MSGTLTRDDIIGGVGEVITRLRDSGTRAKLQIVGGAAIALTIDGERPATLDVDGAIVPLQDVEAVAARIAAERGWPIDWMNDRAKIFLPEDDAEDLLNEFFPGEDLSPKTYERVQKVLQAGLPVLARPPLPDFS